jgi:hypothetical protein
MGGHGGRLTALDWNCFYYESTGDDDDRRNGGLLRLLCLARNGRSHGQRKMQAVGSR